MDYALSRRIMIDSQILTSKITDNWVVDAMADIPREEFVPAPKKGIAYADDCIEVASRRFILEPMVLATMLQTVTLKKDDVVLDIGCASGYSTAILSRIVNTVVGLECDASLVEAATASLANVGADNAVVIGGDLKEGYAKQGPYDVIFYNGSVPELPESIKDQVADGGRIIAAISGIGPLARVQLHTREGDVFSKRDIMEAGIPSLPGFEEEVGFVF